MQVTVDDLGTGYWSLAYIRQLSIQSVKADRAFMAQIPEDGRAGRIVMLIIGMARELGRELTAEGIESDTTH